jgi:hypothetical protein
MHLARLVFAGLAWIFVGLVVLQVFWVGMALFAGSGFDLHREFGYWLSGLPLLVLIAAFVARAGRATLGLVAGLFALTFLQTVLPILGPMIAALHPPTALAVFWLGTVVARRGTRLARTATVEPELSPEPTQAL